MASLGLEVDAAIVGSGAALTAEDAVTTPVKAERKDEGDAARAGSGGGETQPSSEKTRRAVSDAEVASLMRTHKKCVQCASWLEKAKEFHQGQSKCKECYNVARGLQRLAENQGMRQELDKMAESDGKLHAAILKQYAKDRDRAKKAALRLKFSIQTFVVEYRSRVGQYVAEEGEFMWEGEFYEFAKTAKMGFRTRAESEKMWQEFLDDASLPKDFAGPRGYRRVWIKTRDVLHRYADTSQDKLLRKEERLGKNPKQAVVDSRMQMMAGNLGQESRGPSKRNQHTQEESE